jgi:hypothetical protein
MTEVDVPRTNSIWSAVNNTGYSWPEIKKKSPTQGSWKMLCPNLVMDFKGLGETPKDATKDNVHLMTQMNLGVSTEDVDELSSSDSQLRSNEDINDIQTTTY